MKECSRCKTMQADENFWIERRRNRLGSRCKGCAKHIAQEWRAKNPDAQKRRYYADPAGERERHLIRKYGVNLKDYDRMLAEQGGSCAICKRTQDRSFDVDHCHSTGKVRGLLCTNCNRMVGHAADSGARLVAAAAYLGINPHQAAHFIRAYIESVAGQALAARSAA